ncbi:BTAD domain-containing putative transcriptional regulator [Paenibacillus abyssi]|uniref:Bacterial transcriptional activator domain-containing protein n=1 Tax=Paenibacillus abyssi TaxID=1340531 RepID=A0A917D167_9BACL|nr:BTAD domain-containing putative transcriptional regulator [Paenibacillus abyssi]GGG05624.1 hypothetical protein GCM10010916_23320 [Paenibacillus abyssi]
MTPDEQIDGLLRQKRFADAYIRMEGKVLEGGKLDEAALRRLPRESLHASPILMQALGGICCRKGELHEARQWLELAVKGFGSMPYPAGLLSAMCAFTHVLLRLGETAEAETLLKFLKQEYERMKPEEHSGGLLSVLAAGSRLIGSMRFAKQWYIDAVEFYDRRQRISEAADVLAELLLHCGDELDPGEWADMAWRLQRWGGESGGSAFNKAWMLALKDARQQQWELAYSRLQPLIDSGEEGESYLRRVYAQLILFRAAAEIAPHEADSSMETLHVLRRRYSADLQLQHSVLLLISEGCRRLGRTGEAEAALTEAGFIGKYLRLPAAPAVASPAPAELTAQVPQERPARQSGWRVSFFGGLSFERGADEVRHIRWKRKKAQELCVYLLLQPKYSSPKEQLTELLQLGEDPVKANKLLYVIIHQLKQTLYDELSVHDGISMREGSVVLREDAIEYVDVERYLALLRVADQLWLKDRSLSYELYQEAYVIYQELLPELPYFSWLDSMREYVLEKQTAVIRKLCLMAEEQRDHALEETYCQEWLRLRPDQEEAYQQLIQLLIRMKRHVEAANVYEKFAVRCRNELGTEPSEEIRRLLRGSGVEHLS